MPKFKFGILLDVIIFLNFVAVDVYILLADGPFKESFALASVMLSFETNFSYIFLY